MAIKIKIVDEPDRSITVNDIYQGLSVDSTEKSFVSRATFALRYHEEVTPNETIIINLQGYFAADFVLPGFVGVNAA